MAHILIIFECFLQQIINLCSMEWSSSILHKYCAIQILTLLECWNVITRQWKLVAAVITGAGNVACRNNFFEKVRTNEKRCSKLAQHSNLWKMKRKTFCSFFWFSIVSILHLLTSLKSRDVTVPHVLKKSCSAMWWLRACSGETSMQNVIVSKGL